MYQTKTDPPLVLDVNKDDDEYVVTLTGDRVKELYRGSFGKAMAEYNRLKKHYEERAKAE